MKLNLKRAEEILPGDLIVVAHELVQVTHFASGRGQVYIKFIGVGDDLSLGQSVSCAAGYWFQCFDAGAREEICACEIEVDDFLLLSEAPSINDAAGWFRVERSEVLFADDFTHSTIFAFKGAQSNGASLTIMREPHEWLQKITVIDAIPPELKRMEDVEEGETIFVYKSLQLITGTVCNKTQDEADVFFGFTEESRFTRHRIPRKAFAEVVLSPPLVKRNPAKGHLSIEMIID